MRLTNHSSGSALRQTVSCSLRGAGHDYLDNQDFPQNFQKLSEKKGKVGWINLDFLGGAVLNFLPKRRRCIPSFMAYCLKPCLPTGREEFEKIFLLSHIFSSIKCLILNSSLVLHSKNKTQHPTQKILPPP